MRIGANGVSATVSSLRDTFALRTVGFGIGYGLAASDQGAIVLHDNGEHAQLVEWRCDGTIEMRSEPEPSLRPRGAPDEPQGTARTSLAGLGLLDDGTVITALALHTSATPMTQIRLHPRQGEVRTRVLPVEVTLRDSRPRAGILVEARSAFPEIALFTEQSWMKLLTTDR